MSKLDSNDPDALKDLIEVIVGEAIETNGTVRKEDTGHLPTETSFLARSMKL